jgi:hypothetical protein
VPYSTASPTKEASFLTMWVWPRFLSSRFRISTRIGPICGGDSFAHALYGGMFQIGVLHVDSWMITL